MASSPTARAVSGMLRHLPSKPASTETRGAAGAAVALAAMYMNMAVMSGVVSIAGLNRFMKMIGPPKTIVKMLNIYQISDADLKEYANQELDLIFFRVN